MSGHCCILEAAAGCGCDVLVAVVATLEGLGGGALGHGYLAADKQAAAGACTAPHRNQQTHNRNRPPRPVHLVAASDIYHALRLRIADAPPSSEIPPLFQPWACLGI